MMPFTPSKSQSTLDHPKGLILDVRTHEEYVGFHIADALNVPLEELDQSLDWLRSHQCPIIVYSSHGYRSHLAVITLRNHNIEAYDGGEIKQLLHKLK